MKTWHILLIAAVVILVVIYFINQKSKATAAAQQAQAQATLAASSNANSASQNPSAIPYQSYADIASSLIGLFKGGNKNTNTTNAGQTQDQRDIAWCKQNPGACKTWCQGTGKTRCTELCSKYPADCKSVFGLTEK